MKNYTKMIRVRLTEEEYETILKQAGEQNLNLSQYVRARITDRMQNQPELVKEFQKLNYEVNRLGNNLNQIARNYNMNLYHPDDIQEIKDIAVEIMKLFHAMRKNMRR